MNNLEFREQTDSDGDKYIEVGNFMNRDDGSEFFSSIFIIYPDDEKVRTDCGDSYMDYSVSFDSVLTIADKIKKLKDSKKRKNYLHRYWQEHKDEITEVRKRKYKKDREEILARNKRWLTNNRDHWNAYQREYRKKRKEAIDENKNT